MRTERSDPILEEAARLLTRQHSGAWTAADEAELGAWLEAAAEHREAYRRLERTWAESARLAQGRAIVRSRRGPRRVRMQLLAASLAVVLVAVAGPLWLAGLSWWRGEPARSVARQGEPRELSLRDGSQVHLDAGSEVIVQIGARVRRVALVRGEARFTVAHDRTRPFIVAAGDGRITALGTRFDVEVLSDRVAVMVLDGRIGVNAPEGEVQLTAGQASGFDASGALLRVRRVTGADLAWPEGRRHFDDEPLSEVAERFARYHPVAFVFADPRCRNLRVSGSFRMDDLPLFLRTLGTALPVTVRRSASDRIEFASARGAGS